MSTTLLPEWHPQDAVLLAWPHADTDWQASLTAIQHVFSDLIANIIQQQRVVLLVHNAQVKQQAMDQLDANGISLESIIFIEVPYDDTWLRDSGPLSVTCDNHIQLHDFRFNGWGGKFAANQDDQICRHLFETGLFTSDTQSHQLILEGGSIDTDGIGTLLTTRTCLLSKTRNPQMSESDYQDYFQQHLGINKIHWLSHGELAGDDTDSHIDMLARFCNTDTIAYTACRDKKDEHFGTLQDMETELKDLRRANGKPYNLIPLPIPAAIYNQYGQRLPASYANFLIINRTVLVPVYDDPMDDIACTALENCFPDREIIPVKARNIIQQGGSLHCLTMQLPVGSLVN